MGAGFIVDEGEVLSTPIKIRGAGVRTRKERHGLAGIQRRRFDWWAICRANYKVSKRRSSVPSARRGQASEEHASSYSQTPLRPYDGMLSMRPATHVGKA